MIGQSATRDDQPPRGNVDAGNINALISCGGKESTSTTTNFQNPM
jgi:hypothetical protein